MRISRSIVVVALAGVIAACGGGAPTQGPDGATAGPGGGPGGATQGTAATDVPAATQSGGGGAPDFSNGKAHVEVRGSADRTVDLGFLALASHFGGEDQTILNYVPGAEAPTETFTFTMSGGTVVISYASLDLTVTGTDCTTSNLNVGTASASGTVECARTIAVTGAGPKDGVTIKATFDAHN